MAQNSVVGHMSKRWYTRMNGGPMTASCGPARLGPHHDRSRTPEPGLKASNLRVLKGSLVQGRYRGRVRHGW